MTTSLLFEIGVEEIPSGYFANAEGSILAKAPGLLAECGFQFDQLKVYTTPRRFVIHAENFRPLTMREEEKLGPLKDQAYQDGQATAALVGFLKGVNRNESDVFFKETPRGSRVCIRIKKERKLLHYFFETLPTQIEFPKMMRWEASRYSFTRPIRWTFAFVGKQAQKYKISDVRSSAVSWGHRFFSPSKIKVVSSDLQIFQNSLLKCHVVLNREERIQKIKSFLAESHNQNQALIEEVANLVEEPFPIHGTFDKKYLKLPSAVLTTCMGKHQRIFARYNSSGRLTNRFIAIINGPRKNVKQIAKNHESVLTSRLEDAQFFFEEDRKTKLETKVEKLKEMIFLGSLGSYRDKTRRLEALVQFLGREAGLSSEVIRRANRAAQLAKADLTTHLVYEFPELQGIAGSEYARLDGEGEEISKAISGHYLPQNLSENFQNLRKLLNLEGALVGLADRMDLLVGAVSLGVPLSGSQDPYALRRAGGGIIKILRAHPLRFSLSSFINAAYNKYGEVISKSTSEILKQLTYFFKDRLIFELQLKAGTREFELLEGILASNPDCLVDVYEKFHQLSTGMNHDSFVQACKVAERTSNILKGVKEKINDRIEPSLFQDVLERELFDLLNKEEPAIKKLIAKKQYGNAVKLYGDVFYQPVHNFFDRVMVNAEDPKTRTNRQALVKKINGLCASNVADLSYVTHLAK